MGILHGKVHGKVHGRAQKPDTALCRHALRVRLLRRGKAAACSLGQTHLKLNKGRGRCPGGISGRTDAKWRAMAEGVVPRASTDAGQGTTVAPCARNRLCSIARPEVEMTFSKAEAPRLGNFAALDAMAPRLCGSMTREPSHVRSSHADHVRREVFF